MLAGLTLALLCAAPPTAADPGPTPAPPAPAPAAPAVAPVLELDPVDSVTRIEGQRLAFELRAGELDTLLFHLHCLAGSTPCAREAFRGFWKRELALNAADERALLEWRETLRRYRASLELDEDAPTRLNASAAWDLGDKLLLASLSATSLEELRRSLGLLLAPHDAERLSAIARGFEPRFHAWWLRAGKGPAAAAARAWASVVSEKQLLPFAERVAAFYGPALPAKARIVLHVVLRPSVEGTATRSMASVWEDHVVVEAAADEPPEERIGAVFHELFRYFYWARPIDARLSLLGTFAFSPDPAALGLYSLFDEAVASALADGLVAEHVLGAERSAPLLEKELGLHDDPYVDTAAKALVRPLERRLGSGGRLDAAFAKEYLRLTSEALGRRAKSPRLLLKTRAVVLGDAKLGPLVDALDAAIRPIKSESHLADETWPLDRFPELGGVVFLRLPQLRHLEAHPALFGPAALAELRALVPSSRAFVFGLRRSPRTDVYVFAGADEAALKEALDAFLRFDQRFEGTGIVLPGKGVARR